MLLCRKTALLALTIGLLPCIPVWAQSSPKPKTAEKADKGKADKPDKEKAAPEDSGKVNIAIPEGQPVKGIHLPFYDLTGKLKMQFDAEVANRTSDNIVDMTKLKIETFDQTGNRDMLVNFPRAVYDLGSSIIKSDEAVEVRRNDFVLTGVGMEFDTKKRSGRVFSQIRMEIFNRSGDISTPTPTPNGP
ncbi:MAG TPA: LPS export ABC transporter periplasmic protein LptC [Chthoniobacterales bacterium]|jgi:hypothetical protein